MRGYCLDPIVLSWPYFRFPNGIPYFLEFNLRPLAHSLMRVVSRDFTVENGIASLPRAVHVKVCAWIGILLVHLDLVNRTSSNHESALRVLGGQKFLDLCIPGEAFRLLQLVSYLSWYLAYTSNYEEISFVDRGFLPGMMRLALRSSRLHPCGNDFLSFAAKPISRSALLPFSATEYKVPSFHGGSGTSSIAVRNIPMAAPKCLQYHIDHVPSFCEGADTADNLFYKIEALYAIVEAIPLFPSPME
ncbi:hypothetical protein C8R45DRAFT_930998 [Mycena sanguinolenta]|nr:hypothetical protein C8R45DRAFT_930998 [Mycena sanguinolenta]